MNLDIKSNGVCPRCHCANFYQTSNHYIFKCAGLCEKTYELVPLDELVKLRKVAMEVKPKVAVQSS